MAAASCRFVGRSRRGAQPWRVEGPKSEDLHVGMSVRWAHGRNLSEVAANSLIEARKTAAELGGGWGGPDLHRRRIH